MAAPIFPDRLFNPWADNPLKSRGDVERALKALVTPVESYRSSGGARVRLEPAAAHFDEESADLEGFSRLLWGLAPAQVGGADWIDWAPIASGLAHGCDPNHPEYWGDPAHRSQRLVELAAIGFALRLVPDRIWEPLSADQRKNVASYLLQSHRLEFVDNNWMFFRLMISMGLQHVGVDVDTSLDMVYVERLDHFYLGKGWYRDGPNRRADHYIPFAFHYYGLILATLHGGPWTDRYRERAGLIATDITHWFADDGPALCFGRSMTYRFAIAGFFGALALAGDQKVTSGQQKGYYLRNLRWWAKHQFADRDDILPVGYGYSNLLMSEPYNSAQSPYWALKAFLPLMFPEQHPFWSSAEEAPVPFDDIVVQKEIGFVIAHPGGDSVALSSGQEASPTASWLRCGAEKYAKFAYSARCGFNIENDPCRFDNAVLDNMLGFSEDGRHFRVREANDAVSLAGDVLFSRWSPYRDVSVETWIYWDQAYHVRVHCIETPRPLLTKEGGFAISASPELEVEDDVGSAVASTVNVTSALFDIGSSLTRQGRCHLAGPNTNLVSPRTVVPQLSATIPSGVSSLATAVLIGHKARTALPIARALDELRDLVAVAGSEIPIFSLS